MLRYKLHFAVEVSYLLHCFCFLVHLLQHPKTNFHFQYNFLLINIEEK